MGITKEKAHRELDVHKILRGSIGMGDLPPCLFWPTVSPEATRVYCYLLLCAQNGFWPSPAQVIGQCLRAAYGRRQATNGALTNLLDEVMQELERLGVAYWADEGAFWEEP